MNALTQTYTLSSIDWRVTASVTDRTDECFINLRGEDAVPIHMLEQVNVWFLDIQQRHCSTKPTVVTTSANIVKFVPIGGDNMEIQVVRGSKQLPVGIPVEMKTTDLLETLQISR